MSDTINESELPTNSRNFGVSISYPNSHYVRNTGEGEINYVTGPQGPPGPTGNDAQWVSMTQEAFDALPAKDPNTLYVIVG